MLLKSVDNGKLFLDIVSLCEAKQQQRKQDLSEPHVTNLLLWCKTMAVVVLCGNTTVLVTYCTACLDVQFILIMTVLE